MGTHLRTISAFLLLVVAVLLAIAGLAPPDVVSADADPDDFSAQRAMEHVRAIARQPRPVGSDEHRRVAQYIVAQLRELGFEPEIQTGHIGTFDGRNSPVPLTNLIARLAGRNSTGGVLLVAHYDSRPTTSGAGDDASGVAVLLETARALRSGVPVDNDVIWLFSDGEELGLLGAQLFVDQHRYAGDVRVALNFEARGNRGPALTFELSDDNGWLIEQYARAVDHPRAGSAFYEVYRRLPNDTDFSVLKRAGIAGYNSAFISGLVHYHAPTDTPERLDPRSVQHQGEYALSLARHLGQTELGRVRQPNAVYFNTVGDHFVTYPASWSPFFASVVIALWTAQWWLARRRYGLRLRSVALATISWPVIAVLAGVSARLVVALVGLFHPSWTDFLSAGGIYSSSLVFAAIASTTWTVISGAHAWLLGRIAAVEVALGYQVWLVGLIVASAVMAPSASYLVIFPLGGVVLGLLAEWWLAGGSGEPSRPMPLLRALFALPALLILVPVIYLLFESFGIHLVVVPALAIALVGTTLVPWLDALECYRRGGVTLMSGLIAAVLVALSAA
ncbi:MAG: M28 family peptidase [Proteobacteria bacterium]|nr:M28 family peptidase [Pseudomonadota bacterium]